MHHPNSNTIVDSRMKPPTVAKASAKHPRKRKSRAKPKPVIEQKLALNDAEFRALVLQYTGESARPTAQASCGCPSNVLYKISDSYHAIAHDGELGRSKAVCHSDNPRPTTMSGCPSRSKGVLQTESTPLPNNYISQVRALLETCPCTHLESGHVSTTDVCTEFSSSEAQPISSHIHSRDLRKVLLHKILQIGFTNSTEAGNKAPVDFSNLISLCGLTLLHDIASNSFNTGD
ncbi:hypothetical protein KP509_19G050100 [Ceratopteris richardii]|uniref:Uncharacterized protein n=1 Tax=Ceratopteris richardii TaxID=49495 RepID=A0A8T2SM10_CERRI|nr:hypothetical protein KP509_19G050100 [Ceratopteris richardii]